MKIKTLTLLAAASLTMTTLGATQAYAWSSGVEDPTTTYNNVVGNDNATVPVNGTIKDFDPTDPNEPDPGNPTIDWVDVEVPAMTNFAANDASNGQVIAPTYKVNNLSAKGVKVTVKDFVDKAPEESAKVPELKLNITSGSVSVPVVDSGSIAVTPTELGTIATQGDSLTFSYSGEVGNSFQWGTGNNVNPVYDLVLQLEAQA
ncbi:hypothetical protein [Lactococcus petauri]|uniref:hypothetical protein n=1 Tax=Lactococcus petauri TaxID=1940789 RepID=UPI00254B789B|nr:hypothetical protein [Lactococcus petauri]